MTEKKISTFFKKIPKPSNRVYIALVLIVLIITFIISSNYYNNKKTSILNEVEVLKNDNLLISVENKTKTTDSDGDGLNDWEEYLWGTNSLNSDSDGDGTSDGTEVALGRDPMKKGPDDLWNENSETINEYVPTSKIDEKSISTEVALKLFSRIAVIREDDSMEELDKQKLVEDIFSDLGTRLQIKNIYKIENLVTFDNSEKNRIRKYGNDFMSLYVNILVPAYQANTVKSDLDLYIESYSKLSLSLSIIDIPKEIAGIHLNYINNIQNLSVVFQNLKLEETDPIKTMLSMQKIKPLLIESELLLTQLKNYFKNNDIIFSEDEFGIFFNYF